MRKPRTNRTELHWLLSLLLTCMGCHVYAKNFKWVSSCDRSSQNTFLHETENLLNNGKKQTNLNKSKQTNKHSVDDEIINKKQGYVSKQNSRSLGIQKPLFLNKRSQHIKTSSKMFWWRAVNKGEILRLTLVIKPDINSEQQTFGMFRTVRVVLSAF